MSGCFSPRQVDFGIVIVAVVFVPHTARFEPNICAREKQPPLLRDSLGPATDATDDGIGTGALRAAVRDWLQSSAMVSRWSPTEGRTAEGATDVDLA